MALKNPGGSGAEPGLGGGSECPDSEQLAQYVDGVLDAAQCADIEAHLAGCSDCRTVVAETTRIVRSDQSASGRADPGTRVLPFRSRRWVTGAAAALAAAATVVLAVAGCARTDECAVRIERLPGIARWFGPRSDRPELQELVTAFRNEPTRPVEGRLTGGFKYAPPPSPVRGPGDRQISPDVRIAAARIEKLGIENGKPHNLAAFSIAYLALGDFDRAVRTLERAVEQEPTDAKLLSDLAATYLARARRPTATSASNDDVTRAVNVARTAIALPSAPPEALFNLALAYEQSGSQEDAVRAWIEYLKRDEISPWAREAKQHLSR